MKTLLVHLDASPRSALRLAVAHRLAREHAARLTAMYAVMPTLLATAWVASEAMSAAVDLFADLDREQRQRARAMFDREAAGDPAMSWVDAGDGPMEMALGQQALFADLLVLGQADAKDTKSGAVPVDLVPTLILQSGKPALVLPYAGEFDTIGREMLVAWKSTRESARALSAALPWLSKAARVHIARPAPAGPDAQAQADAEAAALDQWLRLHGVGAAVSHATVVEGEVGEALLSLAADTRADLLVMGCYGHSRMRELVLGGATRTVLASMTLPVLMAH